LCYRYKRVQAQISVRVSYTYAKNTYPGFDLYNVSWSIRLRFLSWSSSASRSTALPGAARFDPNVVVSGTGVADFNTLGRLTGLACAFRGFVLSFRGLGFKPTEGVDDVVEGEGFAVKDRTTFSEPSSRFRPSSIGSGELEPSFSALARSICSAISIRSRCSSDVVERSFFSAASCLAKAFGLLSIQAINQPFSVSSTLQIPVRPRCLANSVRVTQRVEFIC